jgi:hypothetical protein
LCLAPAARAQVDQHNDGFAPNLFDNIQALGPIGQQFVPTASSLNFVELHTQDFAAGNNFSAALSVLIRDGTINGPVVGASRVVVPPAGFFEGVTHFDFDKPVTLQPSPEHIYVIQVLADPVHTWGVGRTDEGVGLDTYPAGKPIIFGAPEDPGTADLWFREGRTVPEPSSVVLLGLGALALAAARRRRAASRARSTRGVAGP